MTRIRFSSVLLVAAGLLLSTAISATAAAKDVVVTDVWARASAPSAKAAGAFMTIENAGKAGDRLLSARSAAAKQVEVHESKMVNNVMQMRRIDGLPVAAGDKVVLKPGGLHVMLIDLEKQLVQGERFKMTLVFEKAGEVTVDVDIKTPGAMSPMHNAMHK